MQVRSLPKVSFFIMAYNDAKNVELAIRSVKMQNYPKNKVEIIVIDDASTDTTLEVAKKYKTRTLTNGTHNMYKSLSMGYHAAKGDFCFQLDQDVELKSKNFIRDMITPLVDDTTLTGTFTRYYPGRDPSWVNRYLSYEPAQQDPLFEYFSAPIKNLIVEKRGNYFICDYSSKNIPPITLMFFRMKHLKKSPLWKDEQFFDHETLMGVISCGYTRFAYVPSAGLYHKHVDSLAHLFSKRARNLKNHYLKTDSKYKYKWFDATTLKGILKIIIWIIYANLIIPATIRGIYRALKFKDHVFLAEPFITVAVTDIVIYNFLTLKEGRQFIFKSFKKLYRNIVKN